MVFKQIAGLLARRIVFTKKVGDRLARGERIGLIKFGSRTDVIFPAGAEMKVRVGDTVKGGSTVLAIAQPQSSRRRLARCGGGAMSDLPLRRDADPVQSRAARKGLYILPSMFTAGNIAAGYYAISQAIQGTAGDPWHFDQAAKAIGFAIVFDFFDGGIARLTNTASDFGRELDSLADVIAFGVAPAVLAWMWGFRMLPLDGNTDLRGRKVIQLGAVATFVFLLAGAARLARFNIQVNPQPLESGPAGPQVFCRNADSGRRRRDRGGRSSGAGRPLQIGGSRSAGACIVFACRVSDGEHLALFQPEGHQLPSAAELPLADRDWAALIALIWFASQYVLFALALVYILSGVLARLSFVFRRPTVPPPPPQR